MFDILPIRIVHYVVCIDAVVCFHDIVYFTIRDLIFAVYKRRRSRIAVAVRHVVTARMNQVCGKIGCVQIVTHFGGRIVIVGPGPVVGKVHDGDIPISVNHPPGAVVPRPVTVRRPQK